jgi:hypothetical protein
VRYARVKGNLAGVPLDPETLKVREGETRDEAILRMVADSIDAGFVAYLFGIERREVWKIVREHKRSTP